MRDSELRGYILQYFYERRREHSLPSPKSVELGVEVTEQDILQICDQLSEKNLLDWQPIKSGLKHSEFTFQGTGRISTLGIDVVEGAVNPVINVEFNRHRNTESATGSKGGDHITCNNNRLTFLWLIKAIESSDATPQEKEEAKTLFRNFFEHPLVSKIAENAVAGLFGS
ncbi:hypothetical protein GCAAIG_06275 [Candidatus Electronema halotolerans]